MNTPAPSRPPLLALDDAIERILTRVVAPVAERAETIPTFDALGRVLAADVRSQIDVPPEDNSEMDGYALRAGDVAEPGTVLRVSQRIAAGSVGASLEPGTAARIFTGAQVPAGADAVVMQEQCSVVADGVRVDAAVRAGQSIRRRGEDVERGARDGAGALGRDAGVGEGLTGQPLVLGLDVDGGQDAVRAHPAQQPEPGDARAGADLGHRAGVEHRGEEAQRGTATGADRDHPDLLGALPRAGQDVVLRDEGLRVGPALLTDRVRHLCNVARSGGDQREHRRRVARSDH